MIIKTFGGLCNKLRTIYPYLQYCYLNNDNLQVLWDIDQSCPELFDNILIRNKNLDLVYGESQLSGPIDYIGCNAPQHIREIASNNCYLLFKPNDLVKSKFKNYLAEINFDKYNAVHIRRTEHIYLAMEHGYFTSDDIFEKYIHESEFPVYLATDCINIQEKFINLFGNKIFFYEKIQPPKQLRQTSLLHAMIDIMMCHNAVNFLGSGYSSFSEFISVLRDINYEL